MASFRMCALTAFALANTALSARIFAQEAQHIPPHVVKVATDQQSPDQQSKAYEVTDGASNRFTFDTTGRFQEAVIRNFKPYGFPLELDSCEFTVMQDGDVRRIAFVSYTKSSWAPQKTVTINVPTIATYLNKAINAAGDTFTQETRIPYIASPAQRLSFSYGTSLHPYLDQRTQTARKDSAAKTGANNNEPPPRSAPQSPAPQGATINL